MSWATAQANYTTTDEAHLVRARRRRWRRWCVAGAIVASSLCWLAHTYASPEALLLALLYVVYGLSAWVFGVAERRIDPRPAARAAMHVALAELVDADDQTPSIPAWLLAATAVLGAAPCLSALVPSIATSAPLRIAVAVWGVAFLAVSSLVVARLAYLRLAPPDRAHARSGGTSRRR